jgi:hypothetical protein
MIRSRASTKLKAGYRLNTRKNPGALRVKRNKARPISNLARTETALGRPSSFRQLTVILRGFAFSAFGKTSVITPSFSSALILPCSNLLEI